MNTDQIRDFVHRYLEATGCRILEKTPAYSTVKLSPEADRDLTNRSYYWSFVDRTGAEPETMSFTFVFDPAQAPAPAPQRPAGVPLPASSAPPVPGGAAAAAPAAADSILGRYFGTAPAPGFGARVPREELTFGSRRLQQIFQTVKSRGRYVQMFEEPRAENAWRPGSFAYASWLCVNYKVEFLCDMKRDELHSLAIQLSTGEIAGCFYDLLLAKRLTPRLPPHVHIARHRFTLEQAAEKLERRLEEQILGYDRRWADEAHERWQDELARVDDYYVEMLNQAEPDQQPAVLEQHQNRRREIEWQHRPRIRISVTNCGLFHLAENRLS